MQCNIGRYQMQPVDYQDFKLEFIDEIYLAVEAVVPSFCDK